MVPAERRLFAEPSVDEPDDAIDIWLDGEVIQTFTYDEIGYSGIRAIQELVEKIAAVL